MSEKSSKRNTGRFGRMPDGQPIVATRGGRHEDLKGGEAQMARFRPQRYKVAELGPIEWKVTVTQAEGGRSSGRLVDLGASGIGIVPAADLVLRANETLSQVTVTYNDNLAYQGAATVALLRPFGEETLAGLHLTDGLLNLGEILTFKEARIGGESLAEQIDKAEASWHAEGMAAFKAAVAEFRLFLEDVARTFDEMEGKLPWHVMFDPTGSPAQQELHDAMINGPVRRFCAYFSRIDAARRESPSEADDQLKQFSRRHLHQFILQGPLFARSLAKPLGFAGDYATMAYIYYRHFEGKTPFGRFVHLAGCHHDVCRSVRNRKDLMRAKIEAAIAAKETEGRPIRIASIGSGPAQEFYEAFREMTPDVPRFDVVLFDVNEETLNYCFLRLNEVIAERAMKDRIELNMIFNSVKQLLFDDEVFRRRGPFDLILCSGLYDYLSTDMAVRLTRKLFSEIHTGGELVIGNMAPTNPSRWAMEHLAEWNLIYREAADLIKIGEHLDSPARLDVTAEPLSINLFLEITKS